MRGRLGLDNTDIFIAVDIKCGVEEKERERKHKKDKKDKEKKESKDKREKEGRDKKHKEKDKKEKNREKKKDKDKDRDKDRDKNKTSAADGKGLPGQAEGLNAGKLQKEIKPDKKAIFVDNKITRQYNNGEMERENNHLAEENKDSKFLLELERRIKDDNGGAGNQLVQKFTNADHRKDEGTVRLLARNSSALRDGSEKLKDKGFDAKKIDGKGIHAGKGIPAEVRTVGNTAVQNHAGNFHPKADGIPKLLGKYFDGNSEARVGGKEKVDEKKDGGKEKVKEKKDEGKEKVKEKKEEGKEKVKKKKDDKRGEKRKNKEEKKGHGKDKDRDKDKKEKTKEHTELKTTEQNKLKENNNVGPIHSNSFTQISKNGHENSVGAENLKKRKEPESNGVPHANENWPSKLPRPSSSHPFTENGRILEACQTSVLNPSDRTRIATSSAKAENKECKINGFVETQPLVVPSNKTHTTMPDIPLIEASSKPSHPDTKYLSRIYSIPKVEWSDLDDQEWLFDNNRKPVVKSSEVGDTPQVWAEVVHIEPVDVYALPYVIPY
ncbi:hypothetical protein TSUD_68560 [Trifolium subterraneum]|uniref:Myb-like protein X n=1 Tax=Trifolium subterraneum TaxID=3900 RepID=A0A2Z6N8F6_TRISU|nr:hypothetical protein TSUD_68560 [Trifolium subterraneum]